MRNRLCLVIFCAATLACGRKPASIRVTPTRVKIYGLEQPQRLTAQVLDRKGQTFEESPAPTWASSRPDVVEVDASGRLLSKKEGKAVVTASLEKLSTPVSVEVLDIKAVEIKPVSARLIGPPGTTATLQVAVKNSKDQTVTVPVAWSSSAEGVAAVSSNGVVTATGAGRATVTAKVGDLQAEAEIVVDTRTISRVVLLPATALVRVGDSQHYHVSVFGADGREIEEATARFSSSDEAVASVDAAGVASGHKAGVATIRAQVGTLSADSTLIVN